ncbi:HPr family phosphocarrier protein [Mucisphaera calidilacus]|uniref:HPr-like protein Crh n=1 Tax=Mucisphaera calidilacus TaxID=2527982 RepID=A0A518BW11_9BACT|nr:HPr family phosphocarrier protein [Mucisphaera calidilacus]QDU71166.1 HPr-like protein Crh [Mucisphaera calidilacus]
MTQSSSSISSTSGDDDPVDTDAARAETVAVVCNRLGMHARPAMSFVDTASQYVSDIHVIKKEQKVDAKSIMQLMMLAATQGTELRIVAEGSDAQAAVEALKSLVDRGFDE